jgi:hypothetical protein
MSSFINSAKHFNSIENKIVDKAIFEKYYFPYPLKEVYPCLFGFSRDEKEIKRVVKHIINTVKELQVLCVCLQYKHHYVGVLDKEIQEQLEIVNVKDAPIHLTDVALFKLLGCTLYQIETNHLQELRNLTTDEQNALMFLKELQKSVAFDIVSKSTEFENSKYDI